MLPILGLTVDDHGPPGMERRQRPGAIAAHVCPREEETRIVPGRLRLRHSVRPPHASWEGSTEVSTVGVQIRMPKFPNQNQPLDPTVIAALTDSGQLDRAFHASSITSWWEM